MNVKYRILAKKVMWITVAWLIISMLQFAYEYSVISSSGAYTGNHPVQASIYTSLLTVTLAGIIGGAIIVTLMNNWIRNEPYGWALLYILFTFTLIYFFVSLVAGLIMHGQELRSTGSAQVFHEIYDHIMEPGTIRSYLFWLIVVLGTNIVLLVSDKYGPGVFTDFLLGKYFHPKREERIFMFLDIRSSTTIAEKLGEEKYFNFLKDFFRDATPEVLYTGGEIYQYVGDEMVVSWKIHHGRQNANCIRCFFNIKKSIAGKSLDYKNKYGITPEFKAAFHSGKVMAGEIGTVKRDIVFSGDVLNTASRIQALCNVLGVDILLSQNLLTVLSLAPDTYKLIKIGNIELKGKEQKVPLYTL